MLEDQDSKSSKQILKEILPDIFVDLKLAPSKFISKYWVIYNKKYGSVKSLNGKVFEGLIAAVLCREGIFPVYLQAKAAFINGVDYDFIIYTEEFGPVSLSAKTSLRERWKKADLEALALKNIHRKSKSYLITMDSSAATRRSADMSEVLGLDEFILASDQKFDKLINKIKILTLIEAPKVTTISSNMMLTKDNHVEY